MTDPTSTQIIIKAMRILADDIQTDDGVANGAIRQAAARLEEQAKEIERIDRAFREKIKRINSRHDAITFKQEKEIERLKSENRQLSDELTDKAVKTVRKLRNSHGGYNK